MGEFIRGVGIDVVQIARVASLMADHSERMSDLLTRGELAHCQSRPASVAARLAAKEAAIKALGDLSGFFTDWTEIEVVQDGGCPGLQLHGSVRRSARRRGIDRAWITLTHSAGIAIAQVVMTSPCPPASDPSRRLYGPRSRKLRDAMETARSD